MPLHLIIAGAALLTFTPSADAQERAFQADTQPAYVAPPRAAHAYRAHTPSPGTGFSGAFDVRQAAHNLGY